MIGNSGTDPRVQYAPWNGTGEHASITDEPGSSKPASVQFAGGARRSGKYVPFFLCPVEIVEAVAAARVEGDLKYEPGNWMKGGKEFFIDCLSHAIEHLFQFPHDASEDHLGHAACNIAFMLWAVKRGIVKREDFINAARVLEGGKE